MTVALVRTKLVDTGPIATDGRVPNTLIDVDTGVPGRCESEALFADALETVRHVDPWHR